VFRAPTTSCSVIRARHFMMCWPLFHRRPAPEFEMWLQRQGLLDAAERVRTRAVPARLLALLPASSAS
jgi:hypothetical protein